MIELNSFLTILTVLKMVSNSVLFFKKVKEKIHIYKDNDR